MIRPSARSGRRLKFAAVFLSLGLVVQAVTLFWAHPTAFLVFILVGGSLTAAGIVLFLLSIVSE